MSVASIQDLIHDPAGLIERVEAGEPVTVLRDGRPVAEVRPIPSGASERAPRPYGMAAGAVAVPDDFDAPLPDDLLRAFEGR